MFLPLTLFILSGLSIVILIWHKRLETNRGKGLAFVEVLVDFDHGVATTAEKMKNYVALVNRSNTVNFLNAVFVFCVRVLLSIVEWLRDTIHSLYEKAKNQKPRIDSNATSSVYLKRISEVKEEKETPR